MLSWTECSLASLMCFTFAAWTTAQMNILTTGDGLTPISFTLGLNNHLHLTNGSTITYNKVITQKGTGQEYAVPSVFTCIYPGIYKFQAYSLTKSDTEIWFELYKNNDLIASLYGHTPSDYADSGNAVILELNSGDRVYMKARDQYDVTLYGTSDEIYSTFTGVRLNSLESQETPPAFSVVLDQSLAVKSKQPVLYNKVLLDVNDNYDNNTGTYTVPASGIYIFHFFSLSESNVELFEELYVDGSYICAIYGYTASDYADAGNTVILHLMSGQQVQITARQNYPLTIYGAADEIYSSFSGAMIADESSLLNGEFVAFSAGLSVGYSVTGGAQVVYDKIFINLGNHYDKKTGKFTAPVSGVYEFSYHGLSEKDAAIWLELYHNAMYVNSLYSHSSKSYAAGGNAAVLQLDSGDEVFVEARLNNNNNLYGTTDEIYCTFSGYLIGTSRSATGGSNIIG